MVTLISVLKVMHIITAILMAWPFYALVVVNQRVRLGPPLGGRTDIFMENIIKNRTIPCFIFQATALISGLGLIYSQGMGLASLLTFPMLGLKFFLLLIISVLLFYVHINLQPQIDKLFAQLDGEINPEAALQLGKLRMQRKRMASICMFVVFTVSMFGVQTWSPFTIWLNMVLITAIGLFTFRTYKSETRYGWF